MEIQEYQKIIKKLFVKYPEKINNFGLAYCWLGLIGESQEVLNCDINESLNMKKEIGDVLWYTTEICNILQLDVQEVVNIIKDLEVSLAQASLIPGIYEYSEKIKKFYRDDAVLDPETVLAVLANNLDELLWIADLTSADLPEILEINYQKLMKRRETGTLHGSGDNREIL